MVRRRGQAKRRLLTLPVISAVYMLAAGFALAHAHGGAGTAQLVNTVSGPYLVSAWSDPDPLRVDDAHIAVALSDPVSLEPIVSGVQVVVRLTSADDPARVVSETAMPDEVNRLFFAAVLSDRLEEGTWHVGISVYGDRGPGTEVGFDVEVEPSQGPSLPLPVAGAAVVLGLAVIFGLRRIASR